MRSPIDVGEFNQRAYVEIDHSKLRWQIGRRECACVPVARIVDDDIDVQTLGRDRCSNRRASAIGAEILRDRVRLHPVCGRKPGRHFLQRAFAAGGQDEVVAVLGEAFGQIERQCQRVSVAKPFGLRQVCRAILPLPFSTRDDTRVWFLFQAEADAVLGGAHERQ
ncbi:MAG: hypothetical protein R3C31_13000 [Hyphomonadaceae bacterium]